MQAIAGGDGSGPGTRAEIEQGLGEVAPEHRLDVLHRLVAIGVIEHESVTQPSSGRFSRPGPQTGQCHVGVALRSGAASVQAEVNLREREPWWNPVALLVGFEIG